MQNQSQNGNHQATKTNENKSPVIPPLGRTPSAEASLVKVDNTIPKTPSDSLCDGSELLLPTHCNPQGVAFGGQIMAWMDILAGIAAKRHSHQPVVTAAMDFLHFQNPVKLGEVAKMRAKLTRAFGSSMEIQVALRAVNPFTGEDRFCCSCYFIFVAKGLQGEKVQVPPLRPTTPEEEAAFSAANQRRTYRMEYKKQKQLIIQQLNEQKATASHIETQPHVPDVDIDKTQPFCLASDTTVHMTQLVLPSHANTRGITFGGQVMAWMETCGSISAMKLARQMVIVVSADDLEFLQPTRVGDAVIVNSIVTRVFTTSIEVQVTVDAENLMTGEMKHCNKAYFTYVVVDKDDGSYKQQGEIPRLLPQTPEQIMSYHEAENRRKIRLEHKTHQTILVASILKIPDQKSP